MRSRMTRISASRFGPQTSCIRDMGAGRGLQRRRRVVDAASECWGEMVMAMDQKTEITFASASWIHLSERHD